MTDNHQEQCDCLQLLYTSGIYLLWEFQDCAWLDTGGHHWSPGIGHLWALEPLDSDGYQALEVPLAGNGGHHQSFLAGTSGHTIRHWAPLPGQSGSRHHKAPHILTTGHQQESLLGTTISRHHCGTN